MEGGGSLAGGLGAPGPQADLKAAAIGAVVLLRERLGLRARVSARPVIDREPPDRLIFLLERYLPNRTGVALPLLMLLGSGGLCRRQGVRGDAAGAPHRRSPPPP